MLKKAKKTQFIWFIQKKRVKVKFAKNYVVINLEEHFASIYLICREKNVCVKHLSATFSRMYFFCDFFHLKLQAYRYKFLMKISFFINKFGTLFIVYRIFHEHEQVRHVEPKLVIFLESFNKNSLYIDSSNYCRY